MASVRFRFGKYYVRATIKGEDGKRHSKEKGGFNTLEEAIEASKALFPPAKTYIDTTPHLAEVIFERFPEKHPAHIPLILMYYAGCTLQDAYDIKIHDLDLDNYIWNLNGRKIVLPNHVARKLKRQINRIREASLLYMYANDSDYVNIYLNTGKKVNSKQIYYIRNVVRREINPMWIERRFKCTDFATIGRQDSSL